MTCHVSRALDKGPVNQEENQVNDNTLNQEENQLNDNALNQAEYQLNEKGPVNEEENQVNAESVMDQVQTTTEEKFCSTCSRRLPASAFLLQKGVRPFKTCGDCHTLTPGRTMQWDSAPNSTPW